MSCFEFIRMELGKKGRLKLPRMLAIIILYGVPMTTAYRNVIFPLKLKLLLVMIVLIAASLAVFVTIALKTFKEDKTAYLFESLTYKAEALSLTVGKILPEEGALRALLPVKTQFEYFFVLPKSGL